MISGFPRTAEEMPNARMQIVSIAIRIFRALEGVFQIIKQAAIRARPRPPY
jgi:hypothetical protein